MSRSDYNAIKEINTSYCKDSKVAMEKYTKKLAKENEKFRNKNGRDKTCSVSS